jgi:hypothetical protein
MTLRRATMILAVVAGVLNLAGIIVMLVVMLVL